MFTLLSFNAMKVGRDQKLSGLYITGEKITINAQKTNKKKKRIDLSEAHILFIDYFLIENQV